MLILACGLISGLAGFAFGEYALRLFAPSLELPPGIRGDQVLAPREHARRLRVSQSQSATASYSFLGAMLGLTLGAAGGLSRRSSHGALRAGLTGLILAAVAGAGATLLILPLYHSLFRPPSADNATEQLALALAMHGGIWMAIGALSGVALGLGLGEGRITRAVIGGILGAAVAAVAYEVGGAVLFPLDRTFEPMAITPAPRLMTHLAVGLCVSAATLWATDHLKLGRDKPTSRT
ncbi:MAG: hypothetical protein U0790_25695 [Isosphaeraceae bacterium]